MHGDVRYVIWMAAFRLFRFTAGLNNVCINKNVLIIVIWVAGGPYLPSVLVTIIIRFNLTTF